MVINNVTITQRELNNIVLLIDQCKQTINGVIGNNSETALQWSGYMLAMRDLETAALLMLDQRTIDPLIDRSRPLRVDEARCSLCRGTYHHSAIAGHLVHEHGMPPSAVANALRQAGIDTPLP